MKLYSFFIIGLLAFPVQALEFQSIAENATVAYDAPSLKARKLFVIGRQYPVEVIVVLPQWVKVRDANGELSWIEKKYLSANRTALVNVPLAEVRQNPDSNAPIVLRAEQNVVFEVIETPALGWVKVRHRDGQVGYIRNNQIWGV